MWEKKEISSSIEAEAGCEFISQKNSNIREHFVLMCKENTGNNSANDGMMCTEQWGGRGIHTWKTRAGSW